MSLNCDSVFVVNAKIKTPTPIKKQTFNVKSSGSETFSAQTPSLSVSIPGVELTPYIPQTCILGWCVGPYSATYSPSFSVSVPSFDLASIEFKADVSISFTTQAYADLVFTKAIPDKAQEVIALTIDSVILNFTTIIDGTSYPVSFNLVDNIIIAEQNGNFSVNITLDKVSTKFNYGVSLGEIAGQNLTASINGSINFSNTLQFCLNPKPPAGWVNLVMDFSVDQQIEILGENVGSVTDNLTIIAPIVSVDG
jgi:hypothetical protein